MLVESRKLLRCCLSATTAAIAGRMTIPHEGGSTGILVLRDDDHDDVLVLIDYAQIRASSLSTDSAEQLGGRAAPAATPDPGLLGRLAMGSLSWRRMVVAILPPGVPCRALDRNRHPHHQGGTTRTAATDRRRRTQRRPCDRIHSRRRRCLWHTVVGRFRQN